MTRKCAVVLTYPAHFYQTQLTLRSIRQHLPTVDRVVVIADNSSNLAWPSYVQDCQALYQTHTVDIIPVDTISVAHPFNRWPWTRQQIIKLHLDQIVHGSEWTVIDGDLMLLTTPPESVRFCNRLRYQGRPLDQGDPGPGEKTSQTIFYVRHVLKDQYPGFYDSSGYYITTSHPPFHDVAAQVLQSLRAHVEQLHGDFVGLHVQIAQDDRYSMSEYELIEWYYQHYMSGSGNWYFDQTWYEATWGADRELGAEWFEQRGLETDPNIWQQLPLAKYL